MTRIYLPSILCNGVSEIIIDGKNAHYLLNVLRCKTGENIILFDGENTEYETVIVKTEKKQVLVQLVEKKLVTRESPLTIHLIQGISKGEKMDWVVQKATELGVSRITPIYTQHGVVSLNAERMLKKQEHWSNIIISACEQCGRNTLPVCDPVQSFSEALSFASSSNGMQWILDPHANTTKADAVCNDAKKARAQSLYSQQLPFRRGANEANKGVYTEYMTEVDAVCNDTEKAIAQSITLMIGPEGGFASHEITQANQAGFASLCLGSRVLRTETAAIAAIAALQAVYGDLFSSF